LFREEVEVAVNKLLFEYDEFFILGPVFPHEVVGFSGGHKYIFPGIAADDIIHFFHWLGAVITNPVINGNKWTPTREVVEKAASFITLPHKLFAIVALEDKLKGIFIGDVVETWEKAADLSEQVHITYKDKPYNTILGIAPEMYDDIWVAGKVMYKLEPILADGGTLIIYAPHINEISYTHGKWLDKIGYHTRDYFLKRMEKFAGVPRGIIAHSTHVKGIGTFIDGVEKPRVNVVLATSISEQRCEKVNLDYLNPNDINIADYENREDEGILVVRHAGEVLHRLSDGTIPLTWSNGCLWDEYLGDGPDRKTVGHTGEEVQNNQLVRIIRGVEILHVVCDEVLENPVYGWNGSVLLWVGIAFRAKPIGLRYLLQQIVEEILYRFASLSFVFLSFRTVINVSAIELYQFVKQIPQLWRDCDIVMPRTVLDHVLHESPNYLTVGCAQVTP
jgi:hypothetical protein